MAKTNRNKAKHLTIVFIGTFVLAVLINSGSELFIEKVPSVVLALLFLLLIVAFNIAFDIVGTSVMSAEEAPFHAKAANKIKGSGHAVKLIRNADVVANFCNDIVGDVTGTISGGLAAGIVVDILRVSPGLSAYKIVVGTLFLALVAGITVTGKAWGKSIGVARANEILFIVGRLLSWFESTTGIELLGSGKQRKRGKKT